jgi:hypothetical protein
MPLQPSFMYAGKACAYTSEAHFRCSTLGFIVQAPEVCTIKPFTSVICAVTLKASVFVKPSKKGLAYFTTECITAVKNFIIQALCECIHDTS